MKLGAITTIERHITIQQGHNTMKEWAMPMKFGVITLKQGRISINYGDVITKNGEMTMKLIHIAMKDGDVNIKQRRVTMMQGDTPLFENLANLLLIVAFFDENSTIVVQGIKVWVLLHNGYFYPLPSDKQ